MTTITEDYVSFETAKLLKEKGFSENTICRYADVGGITEKWYDDYRERVLHFDWDEGYLIEPSIEPKDQYEIIGDTIAAPTLQMAMKWLREVHGLHISLEPCYDYDSMHVEFLAFVQNVADVHEFMDGRKNVASYPNAEKSYELAIKYCLEKLI